MHRKHAILTGKSESELIELDQYSAKPRINHMYTKHINIALSYFECIKT